MHVEMSNQLINSKMHAGKVHLTKLNNPLPYNHKMQNINYMIEKVVRINHPTDVK